MIPSIMNKWKQNTRGTYAQNSIDFGTLIIFGCALGGLSLIHDDG